MNENFTLLMSFLTTVVAFIGMGVTIWSLRGSAKTKVAIKGFVGEVWKEFYPYLVTIMVDFIIALFLWMFLFVMMSIADLLPLSDTAAALVGTIHEVGFYLVLGVFVSIVISDILRLSRKKE